MLWKITLLSEVVTNTGHILLGTSGQPTGVFIFYICVLVYRLFGDRQNDCNEFNVPAV